MAMTSNDNTVGPTTLVIFGASGDLTHRKLVPSLCSLYSKGRLNRPLRILGVARRSMTDQEFRDSLISQIQEIGEFSFEPRDWQEFSSRIFYSAGDVGSSQDLMNLESRLVDLEGQDGEQSHRLYYLALAPSLYQQAIINLKLAGMTTESSGWRRIVVEKPFGADLSSAMELNEAVHSAFNENQVFRIDHYLGKETVQNLLVFRFANTIFEPVWSRNYIDNVQITVAETVGVSERAGYYDQAGILRDMFQNHLIQLLTLVAMEPPATVDADTLRNEKVKVLNAIKRIEPQHAAEHAVHAQYQGYWNEEGVALDSKTPTYAALRLHVENWRWQGVPFYLRSGKAMGDKITEIIIQFRRPPHQMFASPHGEEMRPNTLEINIQPDEGLHLQFQAKVPDAELELRPVDLEFHYQSAFAGQAIPEAYERLLLDAVNGDASLFTRSDEIEQAWSIIDPFVVGLSGPDAPAPRQYELGSWGPIEADEFMARDGRAWLHGVGNH